MKPTYFFIAGIILLLIAAAAIFIYEESSKSVLQNKNNLYVKMFRVNADISLISDVSARGLKKYDAATLAYENHDYLQVQANCKEARSYFLDYTQKVREIQAKIKSERENIFIIHYGALQEEISIYNSLFEACEHFESASRYYEKYYHGSGTDADYEMGTKEIAAMNEKIIIHDAAVNRYNQFLAEYQFELDRMDK